MKILFNIIFISTIIVSTIIVYFLFSSKPSQGLGGIGYGIAVIYLTMIFIILLIVLFFLTPTLKIFFHNINYLFIINVILILILSLLKWYDGYKIEEQLKLDKIHEQKVNNYFEKAKNNISNNKNIDFILKKWNQELSSNIYEKEQLLSVYFLLSFYNIENKLLLEQKINELFPLNLKNKLWKKILQEEQIYHLNESFKMALDEIIILNDNYIIKKSCFFYKKYSILLDSKYMEYKKKCNYTPAETSGSN